MNSHNPCVKKLEFVRWGSRGEPAYRGVCSPCNKYYINPVPRHSDPGRDLDILREISNIYLAFTPKTMSLADLRSQFTRKTDTSSVLASLWRASDELATRSWNNSFEKLLQTTATESPYDPTFPSEGLKEINDDPPHGQRQASPLEDHSSENGRIKNDKWSASSLWSRHCTVWLLPIRASKRSAPEKGVPERKKMISNDLRNSMSDSSEYIAGGVRRMDEETRTGPSYKCQLYAGNILIEWESVLNVLQTATKFSGCEKGKPKFRPRMAPLTFWMHMNSPICHIISTVVSKFKNHHLSRLPHPLYSADISSGDFWFFNILKGIPKNRELHSNDEIEETITSTWSDLTVDKEQSIFRNWMSRLAWVIKNGG
jgi:hypothetical protein